MPYVPHTVEEQRRMLETIGAASLDALFRSVPEDLQLKRELQTPPARGEWEIQREMSQLAAKTTRQDDRPSFLGAGCYERFIPSAVDYLASRGEFNTAYTPYQPEVSQGTLQAIFEYQSMICRLTGLEISNASMYDGATALAEAVLMSYAVSRRGQRVLVSEGVHPEYRRVLETYLRNHPIEIQWLPLEDGVTNPAAITAALKDAPDDPVLAVVVQNPNFLGVLEDGAAVRTALDDTAAGGTQAKTGAPLLIACADPIALAIVTPPGEYGADIALGDGQQLGNYPSYGGPTFGFFTTRQKYVRKLPGRIVGETTDRNGKRGYVLTFQTREQHIRRERATSNICTNQGLCCLRGAIYMALLGKSGLQKVAATGAQMAHLACQELLKVPGVERATGREAAFVNEFPLRLPLDAEVVYERLAAAGIGGGLPLGRYFPTRQNEMLFACTELTTASDITQLKTALEDACSPERRGRTNGSEEHEYEHDSTAAHGL